MRADSREGFDDDATVTTCGKSDGASSQDPAGPVPGSARSTAASASGVDGDAAHEASAEAGRDADASGVATNQATATRESARKARRISTPEL